MSQPSSDITPESTDNQNNKIISSFKSDGLSNMSHQLRSIAQKSIGKCKLTDKQKIDSGEYDWLRIDSRTSVLRKIK